MVNIRISSNYTAMDKMAARLDRVPTLKDKAYLDAVLETGFKMTQGAVHVITGSLKSSGKSSSHVRGKTWIGTISYGGVSLGVNNPVTYAIYEKARDGDHDFFTPLSTLDSLWVKAMVRILSK